MEYSAKEKRIYLRLGDRVTHLRYEEWGEGAVVEERTSIVPGGTCLVRLLWEDGRQRTFNNDLDHEQCCYFFGVRKVRPFDPFEARTTSRPEAPPAREARRVEDLRDEPLPGAHARRARGARCTASAASPARRQLRSK